MMIQCNAQCVVQPQSGKVDSLVIVLHGYGANGLDLLPVARAWASELPNTAFLLPDAPASCEMSPSGYQWFSLRAAEGVTSGAFDRDDIIQPPAKELNDFIDLKLKELGVPESRVVVCGFSQGAMMAMYTMPRRQQACAGVIGYSGMLVDASGLAAENIVKMPILAVHGAEDDVVPPSSLDEVQRVFDASGFDVETILRPGLGHGIDPFGIGRGLGFIQEAFEKKENSVTASA